jgi:hypothetical protein
MPEPPDPMAGQPNKMAAERLSFGQHKIILKWCWKFWNVCEVQRQWRREFATKPATQLHAFVTYVRPMVQCVMRTSKDLGSLAQQRVPFLLLWCLNSLHDHHKSPLNNVHYGNEAFYFQPDGAPSHYHRAIRRYLEETLLGQWIGRRCSVECPPCSPNLTPGGSLKDVVYRRKPPTGGTAGRNRNVMCRYHYRHLGHGGSCIVRRTQKCLQANGGRYEHFFYFSMCRSHPFLCV